MTPVIAFGCVHRDGQIYKGSGNFNVNIVETGTYLIEFDSNLFSDVPTVVLTQNHPAWGDFKAKGGKSTDNAVLVAVSRTSAKVITGDGGGGLRDRNFTFIAIGPS